MIVFLIGISGSSYSIRIKMEGLAISYLFTSDFDMCPVFRANHQFIL